MVDPDDGPDQADPTEPEPASGTYRDVLLSAHVEATGVEPVIGSEPAWSRRTRSLRSDSMVTISRPNDRSRPDADADRCVRHRCGRGRGPADTRSPPRRDG